jgi:hypothetical protein
MIDGQLHRCQAYDSPEVSGWLKANAVFGAIVAVGFVAMALIGSSGSGVAERAVAISSAAEVGGASSGQFYN